MRVVITGAAGRIGAEIVEELTGEHKLLLIDRVAVPQRKSLFQSAKKSFRGEPISNKALRAGRLSGDRFTPSTQKTVEWILTENIIRFWYPEVIDKHDGGYRLNHGLDGRWRGPANKSLVTQARTLWFFSRLMNSDYRSDEYLAAARHGYEFMRDRMWDKEFGGFYWELDSAGHTAVDPKKRLYGQAFVLYALTEYVRASGDPAGKAAAAQFFELIETKAHDARHGGYRENFRHDWTIGNPVEDIISTRCPMAMTSKTSGCSWKLVEP